MKTLKLRNQLLAVSVTTSTLMEQVRDTVVTVIGLARGRSRLQMPVVSKTNDEIEQERRMAIQNRLERLKQRQSAVHRRIEELLREL